MRNSCEKEECSHTFAHAPSTGREVCGFFYLLREPFSSSLFPLSLPFLPFALKVRSLRIHLPCSCRSAILRDGPLPRKPVPFRPASTVPVESTAALVNEGRTALGEGEKAEETVIEVVVRRTSLSPSSSRLAR